MDSVIFGMLVCVMRVCVCPWSLVSSEINLMSYFILCCKTYNKGLPIFDEVPDTTVVLASSECLTIGRCLHLL